MAEKKILNIAILGAGSIARKMATTVNMMEDHVRLAAVASRSLEKAQEFAKEFNIPKAYGSYEEMVSDKDVDLVYVATPHSHHARHMKLCLEHGKHVICEKAFTINGAETREIIALAKEKNLYVEEAIWTRYMPSRKLIDETIVSGLVGKPVSLTANLCYPISKVERLVKPELAGGALLDVGVYPVNFAFMHFGHDIEKVSSTVQLHETGVDGFETITIQYKDGRTSVLTAGMYCRSDRKGIIWCENGYIVVENINDPGSITVFDGGDNPIKTVPVPPELTGFEYEVQEAYDQIMAGKTESISMPLEETLRIMEFLDGLRKEWGVKYPME